eukprot:TRINITY_DN344_c0_g1_i1.p1 TRINITY_DN344_c0_g1~~TRINITY_DN344_c0_g1_i1.p1  ORF type:complete len:209 (-),score=31.61 TRINITY_DN344_c0_g1_i1:116-706(-)
MAASASCSCRVGALFSYDSRKNVLRRGASSVAVGQNVFSLSSTCKGDRRFSATVIRNSQAEGPIRRPVTAPPAPPYPHVSTEPSVSTPSIAAAEVATSVPSTASAPRTVTAAPTVVTIEFQRQRAKEMAAYFADEKYEEQMVQGRVFGFTKKNEIGNGRWTMFGLLVGLLTEFATGVSFPEQLKIIISNLGIADLD